MVLLSICESQRPKADSAGIHGGSKNLASLTTRRGGRVHGVAFSEGAESEVTMKKRSSVRRAVVARLHPVGTIRSKIKTLKGAPKQGSEGAPDAWLEVSAFAAPALDGLGAGGDVIVITWLHQARGNVVEVHPRSDLRRPLAGVCATRRPDRPNPLCLRRVHVRQIAG